MNLWGKASLEDLQNGVNRLFDQVWHSGLRTGPFDGQDWAPPMAVIDRPDRYVIELELAGTSLEDIEVTATASSVTVSGQKTGPETCEAGDTLVVCERRFGSFKGQIPIPEDIHSEAISARLHQGVLTIQAPKKDVRVEPAVHVTVEGQPE